jgi:hypothetical protein
MIYQKQFIISKTKILIDENWNFISINESWYLNYCKKLLIRKAKTIDGKMAILIGFATQIKDSLVEPFDEIINNNSKDIGQLTRYWGGRWILIMDNQVIADCASLKALFYNRTENMIASSPELATGHKEATIKDPLSHKYYYNWFLTPGTRFENVLKALPGEYVVLENSTIHINYISPYIEDFRSLQYDEIYSRLARAFENEVKYISKFYRINVALSSGYDSRLIFAICKKVLSGGIETYTHNFPSIKTSDREIPSKINPSNKLINRKKLNKSLLRNYEKQNGGHVLDADSDFYARGQWDGFSKDDVCLRGGMLELAGLSPAHLGDRIKPFIQEEIDYKTALYSLNDFRKFQLNSLKKYFQLYYEHKNDVNYLKQFYLDQRISGWLSYIELGLDLNDSTSIHVGNSMQVINLMISIPKTMMEIKGFHLDYIFKNSYELLNIPFNKNGFKEKLRFYKRIAIDKVFH